MSSITAPPGIKFGGLKPDPFDPNDHYYAAVHPETKANINLRSDDKADFSATYDQGQANSCVANATAAAFWHLEKLAGRGGQWDPLGPSRVFIYWNARGGYNNTSHDFSPLVDGGAVTRDGPKSLAAVGACPESELPYPKYPTPDNDAVTKQLLPQLLTKPSDQAYQNASQHKVSFYYRLDPDRPDEDDRTLSDEDKALIGETTLLHLRQCLSEGFPVIFGFSIYEEAMFHTDNGAQVLNDVWNRPNSPVKRNTDAPQINGEFEGHAVLAIGYDDAQKRVLIQNSWGAGWGNDGLFWMPYSWITDFRATIDFWTIRKDPIPHDVIKWEEQRARIFQHQATS